MEKSRKPKIRFKGYNDDWEQRKLGELASSFEYGLNAASKSYDGINKYIRITDIDDETRTFLDTDLTSPDCDLSLSENYLLKDGDILFARTGASVGKTFIYKAFNGVVYYAGFLIRARLKENCSPQFVFYNTLTKEYEKFIRVTSQRSGQPGVNAHEYATFELLLPKYDEQCEIGKFFTNLDHLITLHQRKLDKLINVKKSMLEKMFPKQGSIVPEIRFNGFTQAWEQRKLEDLLESVQIKNSDGHYSQDDILACSLGTELNKKTIFYGLRSTKESVKSYRIVNINDVIYTKSPIKGYPNGIVRTSKIVDGIVPSLYCVYQKKRDISMAIDTRFIQSYLEDKNRLDYYLFPLVNVGARNNVNITDKEFLKGIIKIPICIEEQIQIVEMLEKVNHLITLHQRLNASYLGI
ncbi:restriction endonuclease subunit S [Catenibacterium mitsuokai]|uniref:Restriction endonuclease subunit S n=1 Tax=Catenibacterium mitsuokai TaxID=100886 RepID=A0AAW4MTS8_9FIRM|nr:restriction endonuclease subunit S [Catenibacterium mitsuokai]MBV3365799.1 restriction endonuclease subunit S [Catenibacterium mitsuokai]MBV3369893.1 restriction endonuclease subunit S [Catenibacterium mitsuokai]MBV3375136.1 restriction endonuclease subunit S [Catenibacterium mitsuokai]MBV3379732.1 restriction endonuclease subunit S [Catenibacterium mitsuokai]MBV3381985.1 restriction endonuclease subunit S [Catenibacterium mitsuokai]